MMLSKSIFQKLFIFVLITSLFLLSNIRETVFETINAYIKNSYPINNQLILLKTPEFWAKFKWLLIVISFSIFASLTSLIIHQIFNNKLYTKLTLSSFIVLFVIAGFFILFGLLIQNFKYGYTLARYVIDFTQTPFLFLLLYASFKVFNKQ